MKLRQLLFVAMPMTVFLSATSSQAQISRAANAEEQRIINCLSGLGQISTKQAQKGTATGERLIAYSMYDKSGNNYILEDTTRIKYSGSRNSRFNPYLLHYWFHYLEDFTVDGTYRDVSDVEVAADSVITYRPGIGTDYIAATYHSDNRIASYEEKPGYSSSYQSTKIRNWYNADGYVQTSLYLGRSTANSQWDSLYMRKLTYTASGLLSSDTGYQPSPSGWTLSSVLQYAHDLQGNLIMRSCKIKKAGVWEPQYRETYGYDALSRPVSKITERISGTALHLNDLDSFFYTGINRSFSKMISHTWNPALKWERTYMQQRHFNNAVLVDTTSSYQWSSSFAIWVLTGFRALQYNTRNNPTRMEVFPALISLTEPDHVYNYYYELYNPASVGTISKQQVNIFPNPATESLSINMPELTSVTKQISITDLTGKMLLSEQLPTGNATEQLDISGIAPGAYIINIATPKGTLQEKFIKK